MPETTICRLQMNSGIYLTIDVRCCCHDDWSQLIFTSQIRRQVKKSCRKLNAPNHVGGISDVTITLTGGGKTGKEQLSAERVYRSDDCFADIYLEILSALRKFDRQSCNHFLPLLLSLVPSHLEDIYDNFVDREIFHIDLVRQVAQAVNLESGKCHDHTKDAFYTFVTCGKYSDVGVGGNLEFESIYDEEIDRHFGLEPHHPEFEGLRKIECQDFDIKEMAIDRLARNTVASKGHSDWVKMVCYLPRFELGDVDRKLALYIELAQKLEPIVIEEHRKLQTTYSQSQGQAPAEVLPDHRPTGPCVDDCLRAKIFILAPNKFHIELQSLREI